MSSSRMSGWFRSLLGGPSPSAPAAAGRPALESGAAALAAVESALCDALCLVHEAPGIPSPGEAARNAFGHPVRELRAATDAAALDAALGMALTGRRVAAWVRGSRLPAVHDRLLQAVGRRAPLVLHAELGALAREAATEATAHGGLHAIADAGAFVVVPATVQEAVDATVVARRVAELALTPGVVALDAMEISRGMQDVLVPEAAALRDMVGPPAEEIATPTPAQRVLFGDARRRVPAWLDPDRPLALGGVASHDEAGAARAGHRVFFGKHLAAIIAEACASWTRATGRPLAALRRHRLDDARHVLVAMGSLAELAEAVADAARADGRRVGAVGLTWLRPFPDDELRQALSRAESVTILERCDDELAGVPPLTREIRAVLAGSRARVTHAIVGAAGAPIVSAQILAACRGGLADGLRGGATISSLRTDFPRRQAALHALQREHPDIDGGVLPSAASVDLRGGGRTLTLCSRAEAPDDARLSGMARAFAEAAGPFVRARWTRVATAGWIARITAGPDRVRDGGDSVASDLVVLEGLPAAEAVPPPVLAHGAVAVVLTDLPAPAVGVRLPRTWRDALRRHEARTLAWARGADLDGAALKALLAGEPGSIGAPVVVAGASPGDESDAPVPAHLGRLGSPRPTCDNMPRHHGEVVQPRLLGEIGPAVPEPRLSVAATPAGAAALAARGSAPELLPEIDSARCTGCGRCWAECPDSAIGARALRTQALLGAGAAQAGAASPQAAKLERAHRQFAGAIDALAVERGSRSLDAALLRDAFDVFAPRLGGGPDDAAATRAAFDATVACLEPALPLAVTPMLHGAAHAVTKGSGDLLLLAVDGRSCQSCGGCVAACGEGAIRMAPATPERVAREAARWAQWETLPDTAAETVARVSARDDVGPLAGALLARDSHLAMVGGDAAEPGSGARLALRQVAAVATQRSRRAIDARAEKAEALAARLSETLKSVLAAGLPASDLEGVAAALAAEPSRRALLADVLARIERGPASPLLDAAAARRLAASALAVQGLPDRWRRGASGLGRTPFVVVAGPSVGAWLAGFPGSALRAPLLVDSTGGAAALARGIAEGLLDEALAEHRVLAGAELVLDAPADVEARLERLSTATWRDMPAEALAAVPALLLVLRAESLGPVGVAGLAEVLASDLPVKVLLLDGLAGEDSDADAALLAIAQQGAFTLATSLAHAAHLHEGVSRALAHRGPALVHVHAPSPSRDGFAPDRTVERARQAVESRAHVLLAFDPAAPGTFGAKLSLAGNPAPDRTWSGDAAPRAAADVVERRARRWTTLQELSGVVTPFTDRVRAEIVAELEARHRSELADLQAAHAARLADAERASREKTAAQIRANLLELVARTPRAGVVDGGTGRS